MDGWAVLGTACLLSVSIISLGLIGMMWGLRREFELASRMPELSCVTGLGFMAGFIMVMVLFILYHCNVQVPCMVALWTGNMAAAVASFPCLARLLRLIICYHKAYRIRYLKYVQPPMLALMTIGGCVIFALVSLLCQFIFRERYMNGGTQCDLFMDWQGFVPMHVGMLILLSVVFRMLKNVNDTFGIASELQLVLKLYLYEFLIYQAIAVFKLYPQNLGWRLPIGIAVIPFCIGHIVVCIAMPLWIYRKGRLSRSGRVHTSTYEKSAISPKTEQWTMAEVIRTPETYPVFLDYACKSLCGESADFLVAVVHKFEPETDPQKQFGLLKEISDTYLVQGAPQEVNISDHTRKLTESMIAKQSDFVNMGIEQRRLALLVAKDEILSMLEQNLLKKFLATQAFQVLLESLEMRDKLLESQLGTVIGELDRTAMAAVMGMSCEAIIAKALDAAETTPIVSWHQRISPSSQFLGHAGERGGRVITSPV